MPMEYGPYAWFEGRTVPIEEAKVNVMTHAFNYGTGVFEGIRAYWNRDEEQLYLFRLHEHYDRMWRNMRLLKMDLGLSVDDACRLTVDLAAKNAFRQDMYVRPIAYKANYELTPRVHDLDDAFVIYMIALGDYVDTAKGLRCIVSSWRRINDNAIPGRIKATGSYLNSSLAATEAREAGFDEAIVLNEDGTVAEGSAMNLFMVRDGVVITTPVTANILEGITRATVLQLATNDLDVPVKVRPVSRSELYVADELFFVGTGAQVAPIIEVDRRSVGTGAIGAVTRRLQEHYFSVVQHRVAAYDTWCTPVYR